jgi:hypothetical protein
VGWQGLLPGRGQRALLVSGTHAHEPVEQQEFRTEATIQLRPRLTDRTYNSCGFVCIAVGNTQKCSCETSSFELTLLDIQLITSFLACCCLPAAVLTLTTPQSLHLSCWLRSCSSLASASLGTTSAWQPVPSWVCASAKQTHCKLHSGTAAPTLQQQHRNRRSADLLQNSHVKELDHDGN